MACRQTKQPSFRGFPKDQGGLKSAGEAALDYVQLNSKWIRLNVMGKTSSSTFSSRHTILFSVSSNTRRIIHNFWLVSNQAVLEGEINRSFRFEIKRKNIYFILLYNKRKRILIGTLGRTQCRIKFFPVPKYFHFQNKERIRFWAF